MFDEDYRTIELAPVLLKRPVRPETPPVDGPSLIYFHRELPLATLASGAILIPSRPNPLQFFPYRNTPPYTRHAFRPIIGTVSLYRKRPFAGNNNLRGRGRAPLTVVEL